MKQQFSDIGLQAAQSTDSSEKGKQEKWDWMSDLTHCLESLFRLKPKKRSSNCSATSRIEETNLESQGSYHSQGRVSGRREMQEGPSQVFGLIFGCMWGNSLGLGKDHQRGVGRSSHLMWERFMFPQAKVERSSKCVIWYRVHRQGLLSSGSVIPRWGLFWTQII